MGSANQKAGATAQLEHKLDLDHHWIQTLFSAEMGKAQGETYKFSQFTTYDPNAKKWIRIMLDNLGGSAESTSPGFTGAKIVWEGEQREPNPQMATMKIRTTEEWVSMKEMKMTGEVSKDGKAWTKSYDATCKRK
jgi:hypothetical protein